MLNIFLLLSIVIFTDGLASIFIRLAGKDERIPEIPTLYFNIFGALTVLFFIGQFPALSQVWLFPIVAALIYTLGNIFMFKAYEKGEVSLLAPLSYLNPAIIFVFSISLLQESITIPKILGIGLIIYGLSFLKRQEGLISSLKAVSKDRNCQFYFLFLLIFALARVIDKRAMSYFQVISYSFLEFFIAVVFLSIFIMTKKQLSQTIEYGRRKLGWAAATGVAIGIKYSFFLKAISQIELSIVAPIISLSILVALALAAIFLKERVEQRWWAAILMLLGATLLVYKI